MADIDLPVFSFLPNWEQGITETLEWVTDVLRSEISGHEQRRSVRLTPRRFFEARFNPFDEARSFMDLWLQRFGAQEFLLPLWHDRAKLSAEAPTASSRLVFDNTFREFETGGLALLRRSLFDYAVVEISGQDDEGLDLGSPLVGTWAAGSVVHPLRPAELDNLQAVLASITRNVGRSSLSFRLARDNPYPLGEETLALYDGFPLVTLEPNRRDDLESRFEQMYAEADFQIGRVYRRSETSRAFAAQFYNWQARGRQQHHELRQTLYRLNGRQKAVWMPSFNKDVTLTRPLGAGSNRLDIRQIGYRFLGGPIAGRDRITLLDDSGTRRVLRITGTSAPLASGEDRLNLPSAAGFTASAGREGSFTDLVRLDQDRVEIEHYTDSDGVCEVSAAFRSFAQGRTTAGTLVQPFPVAVKTLDACGAPAADEESNCNVFFAGWYARAQVSLLSPTTGMPPLYVDPDTAERIFGAAFGDFYPNGVPKAVLSADTFTATFYWIDPAVLDATEVNLRLQFPSGSVGPAMRASFSFQKWNETGSWGGGQSPLTQSIVINPGDPSWSLGNPFDVRGLWPDDWYFAV